MNQTFTERKAGIGCPMCPDEHSSDVVLELRSGLVHLQNDADYLGYCILIFKRHAVELHELTPDERSAWIEDVSSIGRAISAVKGPAKLNVVMLGNMVPHLHCHIIPRYDWNADWGNPPSFKKLVDRRAVTDADYSELLKSLRRALETAS